MPSCQHHSLITKVACQADVIECKVCETYLQPHLALRHLFSALTPHGDHPVRQQEQHVNMVVGGQWYAVECTLATLPLAVDT